MLTDWVLIRRLAFEIDAQFRGAKVTGAGSLPDRRAAIAIRSRGHAHVLAIDPFGSPPAVTVEDGDLAIAVEPGFIRALGAALRGTTFLGAKSRKGDRLLRLTFGSRSRFGVGDEVDTFVELVPRFGNIVLTKSERIVAAAKEFALSDNGTRAIQPGMTYQLPPLMARKPLGEAPETFFESDEAMRQALYVYRRDGAVVQAYVCPLPGFDDADLSREPSLLAVLREIRSASLRRDGRERTTARRAALFKRLADREKKVLAELASLEAKRRKAGDRESLRDEGERIYATLHDLDIAARDEAKERAVKLFGEYKKLAAALPHLDERESTLRAILESIEALRWETERTADEDIADIEASVAMLEPRRNNTAKSFARKDKRRPLEVRTPGGSRILVGRSPSENAELTFRVARPDDLWFHAQGIPGAHVIVQRDDREDVPPEDIELAAAFAAFHSRARDSANVAIDYARRKHVRKQKDAPPGLVWYTDFKTVVAEPRDPRP